MARRKPRGSSDELAIVKAAAWAWYQHGSGSEGKPMPEFDLRRTCQAPKPSRYKLEAMEESQIPSPIPSPNLTDNSLLDTYEIESISKQLDYYIESSSANSYSGFLAGDRCHQKNVSSPETDTSGMKKKKKKLKGFWLRHAVICGSREEVVDTIVFGDRRQRKQVPVIGVANCRPRASHA